MGSWLTTAVAPSPGGSDQSLNVALITTLGTVIVALLVLAGQWLSNRSSRNPPVAESGPPISERVVAAEIRTADNARTLDVLDRHVDGLDDRVDEIRWQLDDLRAWRDEHRRHHGQQP